MYNPPRRLLRHADALCSIFRYYHTLVCFCNVLFPEVIFAAKVTSHICGILATYYVITRRQTSDFVTLGLNIVVGTAMIVFYVGSSHNLFQVPNSIGKLHQTATLMLNMVNGKVSMEEVKARRCSLRSLPVVGITDGFRTLDRISTLIFIEFYLYQVLSLLLL